MYFDIGTNLISKWATDHCYLHLALYNCIENVFFVPVLLAVRRVRCPLCLCLKSWEKLQGCSKCFKHVNMFRKKKQKREEEEDTPKKQKLKLQIRNRSATFTKFQISFTENKETSKPLFFLSVYNVIVYSFSPWPATVKKASKTCSNFITHSVIKSNQCF